MGRWLGHVLLAGAAAAALTACGGYANKSRDIDDHPIVNTGVAATVIMPGQGGIPMPSAQPHGGLYGAPGAAPGQAGPPGQPGAAGAHSSGAAGTRPGGGMTMIGGTEQDIEVHQKINNEPAWAKVVKLPLIVAGYPIKKAQQAIQGPPDPTVKISGPPPEAPPTREQTQADYERRLLDDMEQELVGRSAPSGQGGAGAVAPTPIPSATASATPRGQTTAASRPLGGSIAAELAALRQAIAQPAPRPLEAGTPETTIAPRRFEPPAPQAYESIDRDADGRADRWIFREGQVVVGEHYDENGDGEVDRKVQFAPGTTRIAASEEDTDGDGRTDTWTEFEGDQVVRRRADTRGDGEIDTWTFYRDGVIERHEQDTNGDGFRDRMAFYADGRMQREEEDRDGNGRPDRITHFDAEERIVHQEEDTDGDDVMDIRSFYQEGKLRRREVIQ